ncbi:MAG: hypothetical protein LBB76_03860, partial [Azoarcus sp.]|nr:hypothetical protein [Azoarcus sp.]
YFSTIPFRVFQSWQYDSSAGTLRKGMRSDACPDHLMQISFFCIGIVNGERLTANFVKRSLLMFGGAGANVLQGRFPFGRAGWFRRGGWPVPCS